LLLAINANNTSTVFAVWEGARLIGAWRTATGARRTADGDGNYRGGVIASGINLSLQALALAAVKLPSVPIARTEKVIGTDTAACMQSGISWRYVGLVEGLVGRMKCEFAASMRVVSTGGLTPFFEGATDFIVETDPDLSLWGLNLIYLQNRGR
jgi:type III pantothenate kinase